jgi:hypothetical protein
MKIRTTVAAAVGALAVALSPALGSASERDRANFAGWTEASVSCSLSPAPHTPLAVAVCREVIRLAQAEAARIGGIGVHVPRDVAAFIRQSEASLPMIEVLVAAPAPRPGGDTAVYIGLRAGVRHAGRVGVLSDGSALSEPPETRREGLLIMWEEGITSLVPADPATALRIVAPQLAEVVRELFEAIRSAQPQAQSAPAGKVRSAPRRKAA